MRSLETPATTPNPRNAISNRPPRASSVLYNRNAQTTATTQPRSKPPTLSRLTAPTLRPPLRARPNNNQNVLSLTATKPTRSTISSAIQASKMPAGDRDRPRPPQLSAAAAKAVSRTPLTPKVAAKGPPVVTPLGRRPQNQTSAAPGAFKDDVATPPVAAFLAANITPRSGPRQSRVDSTNTTPNGTPVPERMSDGRENIRANMGMPALSFETVRQQTQGDVAADSGDSKFFYASDAKPVQPTQQPRPISATQKPATFFYANGAVEAKRNTSPPTSAPFTPVLGSTPEPAASKFFYANGSRDLAPVRPSLPPSGSTSTVSSSSRMASTRPGTSSSATGLVPLLSSRPTSPIKSATIPIAPALKSSALPPGPLNRPQVALSAIGTTGKRRVSIDTAPKVMTGHGRNGSVSNIEAFTVPRLASPGQISETSSPPLSPGLSHPAMTMASLLQAVEDLGEDDESRDEDSLPEPQSPTKSVQSTTDAISELVANARRERKVQDLEITNASLEAINRTLERQLRKQTAELRRYRRLSRSGRLSIASAASSRVTSAAHTEPPTDLSDLDEEGDETEEEDFDSIDESDFSSGDSASIAGSISTNGKFTRRRQRDERRLQLDLSKHQELLIDSQKINQSLKRCLNWTEVLIKEGQKALEYNVRVSDVELGGRVLAPVDEDEDAGGHADPPLVSETGLEPPWSKGVQDRDSGIELPADGG